MSENEFSCLEKVCTLKTQDVVFSTSTVQHSIAVIAVVVKSGDLVLYALPNGSDSPIVRWVPWVDDVQKRLSAFAFNPSGSEGLLLVCNDRKLYMLPALSLMNLECKKSQTDPVNNNNDDIEILPSPLLNDDAFIPSAIGWWIRDAADDLSGHIAIVGSTNGHIKAFTLFTGKIIFITAVDGRVCQIDISSGNDLAIIIITNDYGKQWRFVLQEQGYTQEQITSRYDRNMEMFSNQSTSRKKEAALFGGKKCENEIKPSFNSRLGRSTRNDEDPTTLKSLKLFIKMVNVPEESYLAVHNKSISGTYQSNLVTIEQTNVELNSVHKLPYKNYLLALTSSLFVFTNEDFNKISVVSRHLSQCKADVNKHVLNMDFNSESLIQEFFLNNNERVLSIYCTNYAKEQCCVITNCGIYVLRMIKNPYQLVLDNIINSNNLHLAEKLAQIFALDLQKIICEAGDKQLSKGLIEESKLLYSLSRCGNIHHVMMLAIKGYMSELLNALQTYKFPNTNKYHLNNLKLLVFVYQYLIAFSAKIHEDFRDLLQNHEYDEGLANNIIAQAGLCDDLRFLMKIKGIQQTTLSTIVNLIQHKHIVDIMKCDGFWELFSEESLYESMLARPNLALFHIKLVQKNLSDLNVSIIKRLEILYNPFRTSFRPYITNCIQTDAPINQWIETYLLICVTLSALKHGFIEDSLKLISKNHEWVFNEPKVPFIKRHMAAGFKHAFTVLEGNAYGWGSTLAGALGMGPTNQLVCGPKLLDVFLKLKKQVLSISCGRSHTIALTNNGVYTWGSNKYGQLGIPEVVQSWYPQLVDELTNYRIISVVCGQYHCIALDDEHRVFTWGWGVHGQLGHGSVEDFNTPHLVKALSDTGIVQCGAGQAHSVFLDKRGIVWACGSNVFGQLGTGKSKKSSLPIQILGMPETIVTIAAGFFQNCAQSVTGKIYQWGRSPNVFRTAAHMAKRRLRTEENKPDLPINDNSEYMIPKLVDTSSLDNNIVKMSVGSEHSIILTDSGNIYSWGRNIDGQLGIQSTLSERRTQYILVPTLINIGVKIVDICCGWDFSIALDSTGDVWTWGANHYSKGTRGTLSSLEGEIVVINNKNRVLKLPHSSTNIQPVPTILDIPNKDSKMLNESDAQSKLAELSGDITTAVNEKLKSTESIPQISLIIDYFLQTTNQSDQINSLVHNIFQFWNKNDLDITTLEALYLRHWDKVAYIVGKHLLEKCSKWGLFLHLFSTDFKLQLIDKMCSESKSSLTCVLEGFNDLNVLVSALNTPDKFLDIEPEMLNASATHTSKRTYLSTK
ncbi:uncharacterized protein LOC106672498 isoform X2 [Cimex lectularius]|uniref:Uncharacterized protein n=1 Tax=Cimex lectularius TaxID=79782 RepID=A0A8I6S7Y8_CIMLE|nr:uncharacterized protein LOC106672498 isoform X2 [Cimex lectularius]